MLIFNIEVSNNEEGYTQAYGHWTKERMRKKLEKFVRDKGLDPNDPQSWYSLSAKDVKIEVKIHFILFYFINFKNCLC